MGSRPAKEQMVSELQEKLGRAKAAVVASYIGLDVASVNEIRRKFRDAGVEYRVVKNTLMRRVLKGTSLESLADVFTGPTAVAFKYDFEFGKLGKTAKELAGKYEKLVVKGAFVDGDVLKGDILEQMASMPTLEEARAQLLGVINAPASKLLATVNAPGTQLAGVIQAKVDKEEKAA